MFHATAGGVLEPVGGGTGDIELAVRIVGEAMAAGFIVGTGAMHGAVVLGDVEIEGPRAQRVGHGGVSGPKLVFGVAFLEKSGFRGVVAHQIEIGVGEVGLETDDFRHASRFESVEHGLPRVQATPTDFTFGGKALAVLLGDFSGFAEGLGDLFRVADGVLRPIGHGTGGVDADDAVFADAVFIENLRNAAGFLDSQHKFAARFAIAHGGVADGARPDRRDQRADLEIVAGDEVGHFPDVGFRGVRVGVGMKQEGVDAFEFATVHLGGDGEFEHVFERNRRVIGAGFLAD